MTDSVAQDQIVAFVDRILRMKGEAKAIKDDIRDIYAEAKSNGFDKTVLGKLVGYVEKREADGDAVAEAESIFDLYLSAYDSAKRGRVGTRVATHTHAPDLSALLARVTPENTHPEIQQSPTAVATESNVASSSVAEIQESHGVHSAARSEPDRRSGDEDGQQIHAKASEGKAGTAPLIVAPPDGDASRSSREGDVPAPIQETEAPKPLPEGEALTSSHVDTPAEAKTSDQEPLSNGSGEVQDESAIHLPTHSPEHAPEQPRQSAPLVITPKAPGHNSDPRCLNKAKCGPMSNYAFCKECRAKANAEGIAA